MSIDSTIQKMAKAAKDVAHTIANGSSDQKNAVLLEAANKIQENAAHIKAENEKDLAYGKEMGLSRAMMDRLTITDATIQSMTDGLREVAQLNDPVGSLSQTWLRPNGLQVSRMRIPLGIIGIIYESRPNVTIDAASLCIKAGNAVILRGGSEAFNSNKALGTIFGNALQKVGFPEEAVQVVPYRDRAAVSVLLQQEDFIDLIIPRGGEGLIRFVVENSKIPVLKHYKGVCHVYVDAGADLLMAENICFNAKVQRPGVCNAMETLLVHQAEASEFLPKMAHRFSEAGVEIRGCPETCRLISQAVSAKAEDWSAEYLDLIVTAMVVENMDQAISHISEYSSQHTEAIVTQDYERARKFLREVDSSAVMVNASTRFNDGAQLGLGAEIGISTSKLHAFGPMGIEELTTTKFVVLGNGQIRE